MENKKPLAIIVGGSIAGVSCAHTLMLAGWEVLVIEKTPTPPARSPTGAGLGLDSQSQQLVESWLRKPNILHEFTLPLTIDQNQVTDTEKKFSRVLSRDESFDFRAAYWADLHALLRNALPADIFLWGHLFMSFTNSHDKTTVKVKAKVLETQEIIEVEGSLLVAADGCHSSIRKTFVPDFQLRYSGYCAWRGVLDFSEDENSETILGIRRAYPELGKCLYFDLASGTHSVFYELLDKKINWIWYVNQPEPQTKGTSVTLKVSDDMIKDMHEGADRVWRPELARIMRETKTPFINLIYDSDPLQKFFFDNNIVLVGDAAHPTTPHGLRSTNMSILDAAVLGKCVEKWGQRNLQTALEEYQSVRMPVTSKQVLHARNLGRIKQGLSRADEHHDDCFDPMNSSLEDSQELQQKNAPFFSCAPLTAD